MSTADETPDDAHHDDAPERDPSPRSNEKEPTEDGTAPQRGAAKVSEGEEADDDAPQTGPRARLSFARGFPPSPGLDEMLAAFDRGDYAAVRALAPRLARDERPEVVRAARDIARRIEPDRTIVAMMAIAVALLATLALWFFTHRLGGHP